MVKNLIVFAVIFALVIVFKIVQHIWKNRINFGGSNEDPMFFASKDNELMNAAMQKARDTIENLIAEIKNPAGDFKASIKVKVVDNGTIEYMWLDNLKYDKGNFSGTIDNDPQSVKNVRFGGAWQADKNEIYDWLYQKDGKLYGNHTFKASIQKYPKEKQLALLRGYGDIDKEVFKDAVGPLIAALTKNMTPDQMIESIQKSSLPEEKKQEFIRKIREKQAGSKVN